MQYLNEIEMLFRFLAIGMALQLIADYGELKFKAKALEFDSPTFLVFFRKHMELKQIQRKIYLHLIFAIIIGFVLSQI